VIHPIKQASALAVMACVLAVTPVQVHATKKSPQAQLRATVSAELEQDQVRIVFSAQAEGPNSTQVNDGLSKALAQAKQTLGAPVDVTVHSASFHTYPVYGKEGQLTVWRGRADWALSGDNISAVIQAADKLTGQLAVSSVVFSLAEQTRRQEQVKLIDQVAEAFEQKAKAVSQAFGFEGFRILELDLVDSGEVAAPRLMMTTRSAPAQDAAPLELAPGRETVSVTVSGRIELR
jgi:predicted secreted protein